MKMRSGSVAVLAAVVGLAVAGGPDFALADGGQSVARQWNDTMLNSIKKDRVRPPVQARNLFHASVAMYDAWAAYEPTAKGYLFTEKIAANDIEAARRESVSYAAYRVMRHRFATSPNVAIINPILDARMAALGYPTTVTTTVGDTPAAVGNRIAAQLIAWALTDNSREQFDHATAAGTYPDVNEPLVVALPFNPTVSDPSRYQPLVLDFFIDQNGNVIPGGFPPKLAPFWGFVRPYGLLSGDMDPSRGGVYFNPPPCPILNGFDDATYRDGHQQVLLLSSWLTPDDGVMIDISPLSMGNNPLGADTNPGRTINPATGEPYEPNIVKRGDWARCLAEFWADGPSSTTPPGHWNEIANHVVEHPAFERRMGGTGPELDPLEWDVKMYVALNGSLHDAAICAWGVKGFYDASRPITAIRHLVQNGQCSDPSLPSYHPNGIQLVPGLVEVITQATTAIGERHEDLAGYEGLIAIRSWPGAPADPPSQYSGVEWMLGGNWVPYQRPSFVSPPFAGYVSGHSTYSRAGAETLKRLTGTEYFPGGMGVYTCVQNQFLVFEDGPSETFDFQWATYYDAADNSGQSRILGGIHPYFDDYPGRVLGSKAAERAHARSMDLFEPVAPPACAADFDSDGTVGAADLAAILSAWGGPDAAFDLDGDGTVGASDLAALLSAWGTCPQ
ncbi:MAG: hypothetical protein GC172_10105 [Phycisphaera sp.]|nr:hypothetical protein [Phycisphaera sp.]